MVSLSGMAVTFYFLSLIHFYAHYLQRTDIKVVGIFLKNEKTPMQFTSVYFFFPFKI